MSSTTSGESNPSTVSSANTLTRSAPAQNTVYVGDLPAEITKEQLSQVFSQASPVLAIHIHAAKKSVKVPRAFAYVTYSSVEDANAAIREFNQTEFSGKPCRVIKSQQGAPAGPAEANIFVKNLPLNLSAIAFHDTFAAFGEVLSSKLAVDRQNASKGYGFVQYASGEQAQKAIEETNGSMLEVEGAKKPLQTSLWVKKEARPAKPEFTNLYFKNLPAKTTLESFKKRWGKYGAITSAILIRDKEGKPTGRAFANFEKPSAAAKVVAATSAKAPHGVHAVRALTKAERERYQSRQAAQVTEASA
ncbi:uncharacterized protein VP01_1192g1 [Puccinia sorghi]|uniref:RRM domain-containing protein n=1 Tax=Puccinia sorghi TaxID=27349 RepID=A0A0L6VQZ6_9BASI|nr:uncharacterized protein VP01_1192g1 [Puccinia sorghi]